MVVDSGLDRCKTAIEVKEDSLAHLLHCTLHKCSTGMICRTKNWRYGTGGDLKAFRCQLTKNEIDATIDEFSSLLINDSRVSQNLPASIHQVDCGDRVEAQQSSVAFPIEASEAHNSAPSVWAQAIRPQRGAPTR